ncbi:MAG: helix-turn-helix domain-containing protein [Halobacteriota archaeon]|nr:helix-turn-helix domain-containing protein [Halobacteriota archaeon]
MSDLSEETSQLFKASGHRSRIEILKILVEDPKTAKEIAEQMGYAETYVHKHLHRLTEEDLIRKENKYFTLSTCGKIFVNSLDGIEVVGKYKEVWGEHDIGGVPQEILRDIRSLRGTDLISSAPNVLVKFNNMALNAKKKILFAANQIPMMEEIINKGIFDKRVDITLLISLIEPDLLNDYSNNDDYSNLDILTTNMDNIYMGVLVIDDGEAGVIFQDKRGSLDWDYAILGRESKFISWAEKNFWNMCENSKDISETRMTDNCISPHI